MSDTAKVFLACVLGAIVGYFVGNVLVGAIVGGIFGVVNFEILSIRVLRVVPATHSVFRS